MSLKDAPKERQIVDFDKPGAPVPGDGRKCDYPVIAEGAQGEACWVAPLELKKGGLRASDAVRQLRAGAEAADKPVAGAFQTSFRPTVAFGSLHKLERAALREKRNWISFRGRLEAVRLMKCGDRLVNALGP